jgi:hypothetical protein
MACGLLAGLALSVKPTALAGIGAALLAALPRVWGFPFPKKKILAFSGLFGALALAPWLLKNWAFTGNPVYPYAVHWFSHGRQFSEAGYLRLLSENRQFLPLSGWGSWLALPWTLLMPEKSGEVQFVGPLLLAFAPLLFLIKIKDASLSFLKGTALLLILTGLFLSHMLRFLMPGLLLILMVYAAALADRTLPWRRFWMSLPLVSALLCLPAYLNLGAARYDGTGIWTGKETAENYLKRVLLNSYEDLAEWTAANLPRDARLLIVGDARGVYYERNYCVNSVFDEQVLAQAARKEGDSRGIMSRLRRMGVTHLVVNTQEGVRNAEEYGHYELTEDQWRRLGEFAGMGLEPVYFKKYQAVYALKTEWGKGGDPYVADPLTFFHPSALAFTKCVRAGNWEEAESRSEQVLRVFPGESYWWEMRGFVQEKRNEDARAEEAYRKGDEAGRLTQDGYRRWIRLEREKGAPGRLEKALERAKKNYPGFSEGERGV